MSISGKDKTGGGLVEALRGAFTVSKEQAYDPHLEPLGDATLLGRGDFKDGHVPSPDPY